MLNICFQKHGYTSRVQKKSLQSVVYNRMLKSTKLNRDDSPILLRLFKIMLSQSFRLRQQVRSQKLSLSKFLYLMVFLSVISASAASGIARQDYPHNFQRRSSFYIKQPEVSTQLEIPDEIESQLPIERPPLQPLEDIQPVQVTRTVTESPIEDRTSSKNQIQSSRNILPYFASSDRYIVSQDDKLQQTTSPELLNEGETNASQTQTILRTHEKPISRHTKQNKSFPMIESNNQSRIPHNLLYDSSAISHIFKRSATKRDNLKIPPPINNVTTTKPAVTLQSFWLPVGSATKTTQRSSISLSSGAQNVYASLMSDYLGRYDRRSTGHRVNTRRQHSLHSSSTVAQKVPIEIINARTNTETPIVKTEPSIFLESPLKATINKVLSMQVTPVTIHNSPVTIPISRKLSETIITTAAAAAKTLEEPDVVEITTPSFTASTKQGATENGRINPEKPTTESQRPSEQEGRPWKRNSPPADHTLHMELQKEREAAAKRWAPVVWLHPLEQFYPGDVQQFLARVNTSDNSGAWWRRSERTGKLYRTLPRGHTSEQLHLTVDIDTECCNCPLPQFLYGQKPQTGAAPPVYVHIHSCYSPSPVKRASKIKYQPPPASSSSSAQLRHPKEQLSKIRHKPIYRPLQYTSSWRAKRSHTKDKRVTTKTLTRKTQPIESSPVERRSLPASAPRIWPREPSKVTTNNVVNEEIRNASEQNTTRDHRSHTTRGKTDQDNMDNKNHRTKLHLPNGQQKYQVTRTYENNNIIIAKPYGSMLNGAKQFPPKNDVQSKQTTRVRTTISVDNNSEPTETFLELNVPSALHNAAQRSDHSLEPNNKKNYQEFLSTIPYQRTISNKIKITTPVYSEKETQHTNPSEYVKRDTGTKITFTSDKYNQDKGSATNAFSAQTQILRTTNVVTAANEHNITDPIVSTTPLTQVSKLQQDNTEPPFPTLGSAFKPIDDSKPPAKRTILGSVFDKLADEDYSRPAKGTSGHHFTITYWFFYPYNQGKSVCTSNVWLLGRVIKPLFHGECLGQNIVMGNHVGDWEHLSIYFESGKPKHLYISAHNFGAFYSYRPFEQRFVFAKQDVRDGLPVNAHYPDTIGLHHGRLVVYSAKGSHGLWPMEGSHLYNSMVVPLQDETEKGQRWDTRDNVEIIDTLGDMITKKDRGLDRQWLQYRGRWGNPSSNCHVGLLGFCELNTGPAGIPSNRINFPCHAPNHYTFPNN